MRSVILHEKGSIAISRDEITFAQAKSTVNNLPFSQGVGDVFAANFTYAREVLKTGIKEALLLAIQASTEKVDKYQRSNNFIANLVNNADGTIFSDGLTGFYSRKFFEEEKKILDGLLSRNALQISLIIMDIDFFKSVNDTHGHHIGDEIIRHISKIIKQNIRLQDIPVRYGGEEMVVVLPNTDLTGGYILAEKIRTLIEKNPYLCNTAAINSTVSIGVGSSDSNKNTINKIVQSADSALYAAKRSGRNNTQVSLRPQDTGRTTAFTQGRHIRTTLKPIRDWIGLLGLRS